MLCMFYILAFTIGLNQWIKQRHKCNVRHTYRRLVVHVYTFTLITKSNQATRKSLLTRHRD